MNPFAQDIAVLYSGEGEGQRIYKMIVKMLLQERCKFTSRMTTVDKQIMLEDSARIRLFNASESCMRGYRMQCLFIADTAKINRDVVAKIYMPCLCGNDNPFELITSSIKDMESSIIRPHVWHGWVEANE